MNMTYDQILNESTGDQAYYSVGCCWWTSFPEDLGKLPPMKFVVDEVESRKTGVATGEMKPNPGGPSIPCCPHCGSVLMQAPLEAFMKYAKEQPDRYGRLGIETFVASHHRNSPRCFKMWVDYEIIINPFPES